MHIGNKKDNGPWCESQLGVLLGNRGADIFSDGISKSLGSGERQPYLTGEVGDAMCGRKHMEDEPSAECTRACVAHGSKFALIVGDKIYALETTDKAALTTLDEQAGHGQRQFGRRYDPSPFGGWQMRGEPGPTERACSGNRNQKVFCCTPAASWYINSRFARHPPPKLDRALGGNRASGFPLFLLSR